ATDSAPEFVEGNFLIRIFFVTQREEAGKGMHASSRIEHRVFIGIVCRAHAYQCAHECTFACKRPAGDKYGASTPADDARVDKHFSARLLRDRQLHFALKGVNHLLQILIDRNLFPPRIQRKRVVIQRRTVSRYGELTIYAWGGEPFPIRGKDRNQRIERGCIVRADADARAVERKANRGHTGATWLLEDSIRWGNCC